MEVKVHMLHDLPTDPPWTPGDPRDDAAQRAGPAPAVDNALYSPMWLFNGAEVMARGWATPRPEPWGLVTHLVTFSDAFGKVRARSVALGALAVPRSACSPLC